MRILIIGVDYAPDKIGIAPYTTALAEYLARTGNQVTVVTTFAHYPTYRWTSGRRLFASENQHDVRIVRVWCWLPSKSSALRRVLFDTSFAALALVAALILGRRDIVIGVCVPAQSAIAAGVLSRLWKRRSVMLVHDLPVDAAVSVGMLQPGTVAFRIGTKVERIAFSLVDHVVIASGRFRRRLHQAGVHDGRITQLANWSRWARTEVAPDSSLRAELGASNGDFLVVHTGNIGEKQDLGNVVEAAALLPVGFHVAIVGDGQARRSVEDLAMRRPGRVTFLGLQSEDRYETVLASADALLLNQREDILDSVIPSKLVAYMAAGKPVIAAVHHDSVAAELVRGAECGVVVPAGDPVALAKAIEELRRDRKRNQGLGAAGRRYVTKHFDREVILAGWRELLGRLSSHNMNADSASSHISRPSV
jgi:colanic acid biosynthesis glycosyl transferase WcaI